MTFQKSIHLSLQSKKYNDFSFLPNYFITHLISTIVKYTHWRLCQYRASITFLPASCQGYVYEYKLITSLLFRGNCYSYRRL